MSDVILKSKALKSVQRRHPWIFSGAIESVDGSPAAGDTVEIRDATGMRLGLGAYSPESQITVRVWTFDPAGPVDREFFRARLARAIESRRSLLERQDLTACRLVNAESDGLPGLIVDRYGDCLVCQFLTAGSDRWKLDIAAVLSELWPSASLFERSDSDSRVKEGLPLCKALLSGREPPELIEIREGPCAFLVDVRHGHKTGFYLDQRENRAQLAGYVSGSEVLNCFAYTGAFGVQALKAGATRAINVESSATALGLARRNAALNGIEETAFETVEGNVHTVLRSYRDAARSFDVIILDPPKFAEARGQVMGASRGY